MKGVNNKKIMNSFYIRKSLYKEINIYVSKKKAQKDAIKRNKILKKEVLANLTLL